MKLDYDIYSYIVQGVVNGTLKFQLVREKVIYELSDIDQINLNEKSNDSIRFKLLLCDMNNRKIFDEDNHLVFCYESLDSLKENYIKIDGKKNTLKKRQENFVLVQIPETIKVPLDEKTSRLSTIEQGKWIDITDVNNLKFYTDKRFKLLFEVVDDNLKSLKRM